MDATFMNLTMESPVSDFQCFKEVAAVCIVDSNHYIKSLYCPRSLVKTMHFQCKTLVKVCHPER